MKDIQFSWSILKLDTVTDEIRGDVVTKVLFRIRAETEGYLHNPDQPDSPTPVMVDSDSFGTVVLSEPGEEFTPYADLSEEQVVEWVRTTLGESNVAQVVADLTKEVVQKSSPPKAVEPPSLPWKKE